MVRERVNGKRTREWLENKLSQGLLRSLVKPEKRFCHTQGVRRNGSQSQSERYIWTLRMNKVVGGWVMGWGISEGLGGWVIGG